MSLKLYQQFSNYWQWITSVCSNWTNVWISIKWDRLKYWHSVEFGWQDLWADIFNWKNISVSPNWTYIACVYWWRLYKPDPRWGQEVRPWWIDADFNRVACAINDNWDILASIENWPLRAYKNGNRTDLSISYPWNYTSVDISWNYWVAVSSWIYDPYLFSTNWWLSFASYYWTYGWCSNVKIYWNKAIISRNVYTNNIYLFTIWGSEVDITPPQSSNRNFVWVWIYWSNYLCVEDWGRVRYYMWWQWVEIQPEWAIDLPWKACSLNSNWIFVATWYEWYVNSNMYRYTEWINTVFPMWSITNQ